MFHYIFFICFSLSLMFSQDCGDDDCNESFESYINCIDDCSITTDILVSIGDYSAHIDSQHIIISIDVGYLENVEAVLFNLSYDESVLSIENSSDCYINQNLNTNNINFFVNAITPGYIQGVLYTFEDLVLNGSLINIKFKINDGLFLGATSNLEFISFIINNTDISDYSQDGILTIGSSGCTDLYACNYDSSAILDDGTCAYEYDCADLCGGNTVEDCAGECGGSTLIDDCGICGGQLTLSHLPGEPCDCNGQTNDACGICGGSLVDESECCDGILDDCGICNGDGTWCLEGTILFGNLTETHLDILYDSPLDIGGFQFSVSG